MGFLDGILSPALTATSQAVAGRQSGEMQGIMAKLAQDRQAKEDELKRILQGAQVRNIDSEITNRENPQPTYDSDRGVMVSKKGVATPVEGVKPKDHVADAVAVANATKGIPTYGDLHPKPDQALVQTQAPDGSVIYTPRGEAAGMHAPSKVGQGGANLPAPLAAKVGQFGEMLKKASDLMPATDALNVSLGNSAGQDVATHGVGAFGMHIPGTQGVGSLMVNHSPEYATYQAALSPFVLAAAHALSGARINDTQVQQIRASIEIKPGDTQAVRQQKHKNMIDLINSIGGSLPGDAIGAQEDQMEPQAMGLLKGYGYKAAARKSTPATAGPAHQQATSGASDPGGDINLGKPSHAQALWDAAVKLHGEAKVIQEFGPRPQN